MQLRQTALIGIITLLLSSVSGSAQQRKLEPIPISEGLASLLFVNMRLSLCPADERWLAYQVNDVRRWTKRVGKYADLTTTGVPSLGAGADIWLINTRTRESRNLTGGAGSSWAPAWSPNGKYLAFYSDRDGRAGIWLWDRAKDQLRKLSAAIPRALLYGVETPNWTPDSRRILVKIFPNDATFKRLLTDPGDAGGDSKVRLDIYQSTADPNRADTPAPRRSDALTIEEVPDFEADLAFVDVADGTVTRLSKGHVPAGYQLSPDGNRIAFLNARGLAKTGPAFDLVVISLPEKKITVLASDLIQGSLGERLVWSPDSTSIGYLSASDWFLISATGGTPRKLTGKNHPPFRSWEQLPVWSTDGRWLYFLTANGVWKVSATGGEAHEVGQVKGKRLQFVVTSRSGQFWTVNNGRSLVLVVRDDVTKRSGFYTMDLASGRTLPLLEDDKEIRRHAWTTASPESDCFYYVAQDAGNSPDIWTMHAADGAAPKRLTNVNPLFERYVMGESKLIEWTSSDGVRLRGALMLPAGYKEGQRYPLIVNVYGGSMLSDRVNQFGFTANTNVTNQQFWATRGYAVLLPDTPLRVGTPMLDLAKTVLPGVDKVIEMGIADPDRLGVWGGSYGGYSTLALLVQTNRFKAAAVDSGFANLLSVYGWMPDRSYAPTWQDWAETAGRMGGSPWQHRERYLENSPVFYLDRVQTPLLIMQGTDDPGGKDFYSNEIFMNLRRLGKAATYLKYKGAGHTISSFSYLEQVDVLQRMLTWFDSHLKSHQNESR